MGRTRKDSDPVPVPSWLRGLPRGHEKKRAEVVIPHKNARKKARSSEKARWKDGQG